MKKKKVPLVFNFELYDPDPRKWVDIRRDMIVAYEGFESNDGNDPELRLIYTTGGHVFRVMSNDNFFYWWFVQ
jgi:hypothetical protein